MQNTESPFFDTKYPTGTPQEAIVLNKVMRRIKKKVYLLDIITLSHYRKDAHLGFYSDYASGNQLRRSCTS